MAVVLVDDDGVRRQQIPSAQRSQSDGRKSKRKRRIRENDVILPFQPRHGALGAHDEKFAAPLDAEIGSRLTQRFGNLFIRFYERHASSTAREGLKSERAASREEIQDDRAVDAVAENREERFLYSSRRGTDAVLRNVRQPAAA